MKATHEINATKDGTIYTFEDGTTLDIKAAGSTGHLTKPARDGCGTFGFPIRNAGDALHALMHDREIPSHCKAW